LADLTLKSLSAILLVAASACGGTRDVIPESRDVHVAAVDAGAGAAPEGYVYVARRRHGAVALAEARGIDDGLASRVIDKLADQLEGCAGELEKKGQLSVGAVRVVAQVGLDGAVGGLNVKVAEGPGVAANALLCVVTPIKLLAFPLAEGDAGARGLAIEATWSRAFGDAG
jgi:hypothetical protein